MSSKKNRKSARLNVRVATDVRKELERIARRLNIDLSAVVRMALSEWLGPGLK